MKKKIAITTITLTLHFRHIEEVKKFQKLLFVLKKSIDVFTKQTKQQIKNCYTHD